MRPIIWGWPIMVLILGCGQGAREEVGEGEPQERADAVRIEAVESESADREGGPESEAAMVRDIGPDEAESVLQEKEDLVVLDVRRSEEYRNGHIEGATNIDFYAEDFKEQVGALDKNQPYLVHCASGGRSSKAREMMKEMGFQNIYHLEGGFNAWEEADKPVTK